MRFENDKVCLIISWCCITLMTNHDEIAYQDIYEIQFHPLPWIILDAAARNPIAFGWRKNAWLPSIYK